VRAHLRAAALHEAAWRSSTSRSRGVGVAGRFPAHRRYFQREVMDCALEDRDGLGVDLCLGRRLSPLLRNARAQSGLSQSNQATNETWRGSRRVKQAQ